MASASYDSFLKGVNPFYRTIPKASFLLSVLFAFSIITGIAAVALINYGSITDRFFYIIVKGAITGILAIMLPTLLTTTIVKSIKRYIDTRYIMFLSMVGAGAYSVFILLASIVYILSHDYAIASVIILVGDASIFGWWFFVNRVLLGQKKRAAVFAIVQPVINILLYIPSSSAILSFSTPFSILLLKLFAGMFVFMIVSYTIMYALDRPIKRKYGFHSIDAFSQMLQNWLFDVNISTPFGVQFGKMQSISTDTMVFRKTDGSIKSIFFAPDIHYGPSGSLGGSSFPYLLERYAYAKYGAPGFIMHCAVNMDHNPISSSQLGRLKQALDRGVATARPGTKSGFSFTRSSYEHSTITRLGLGAASLFTITRAPRITEDVSPDAASMLKKALQEKFGASVMIDAHNSRYESAPKEELDGVTNDSVYARNYLKAIELLGKPANSAKFAKLGVASEDIYYRLKNPIDIAKGNLNVAVFGINGSKFAIIQFNANNMNPVLRNRIVSHVLKKHGVHAEVYTSDTHAVNSIGFDAENVMGKFTKYNEVEPFIDKAVSKALGNMEQVKVYYGSYVMKNFKVWGPNAMEKILALATNVYNIARTVVPIIIAVGFIAATWAIFTV